MIKYDKRKFKAYQTSGVDEAEFQKEETKRGENENWNGSKRKEGKKCSFCFKKSNELIECKYCKELFCKDHIEPKTGHDFLRSKGGHPCKPYTKQQKDEQPSVEHSSVEKNRMDERQSFWNKLRKKSK